MIGLTIIARHTSIALAGILFLLTAVLVRANQAATVALGSSVTFSVTADGTAPFSYQWRKDGADISSATSNTFNIVGAQVSNSGSYSVLVSNSAGSTTSDVGVLTVQNLLFTTQPLSQSVALGSAVTLTAVATGSPSPTYQWQLNGTNISGATSASLTLSNVKSTDGGTYTVVATNSSGSLTSSGAVLTVQSGTAPVFTTQPVSQSVSTGASVTLTAAASGSPAPAFQWQFNGASITGATSASFTIASALLSNAGSYTVVASNSVGSATSTAATLTVNSAGSAPAITTQPVSKTVTAGASVTFTVAASGSPAPTFQWKRNAVSISGATSATLTLTNVQSTNAGTYTVVATNSSGIATSSAATLTVNAAGAIPAFTTQPLSQTAVIGGSVTLTVAASGSPAPTYQWRKNGANISGATSSSLAFTNVLASDAATYTVVATNTAGTATSSGAVLTVVSPTVPSITTQPVSQTVVSGANVTFTAAATGQPSPTYQWQKNGANIAGATSATLTLTNVTATSAGTYKLFATNSAGTVSSTGAVLTVQTAPVITSQPASKAATVGNAVTFSVTVTGSPAPSFQWKFNGAVISGANASSLTIASVTVANAGNYSVVATNAAGVSTSVAAILTVNTIAVNTQDWEIAATGDFNGDGSSDIFWQNSITGERSVSLMNGTTFLTGSTLGIFPLEWTIAATGDFNGDGKLDIIWTNSLTGERAIWLMNGTTFLASSSLGIFPLEWTVAATGDFNADGKPDVVWSNSQTGERALWLMNGTTFLASSTLGIFPLEWTVAATGDFNGDGKPDIVWSNSLTGERALWLMDGTNLLAVSTLGIFPLEWTVAATGDFNGDGKPDIVWSNSLTGEKAIWLMNGTTFVANAVLISP